MRFRRRKVRVIPTVLTDFTRPLWPDGNPDGPVVYARPGVVAADQTVRPIDQEEA